MSNLLYCFKAKVQHHECNQADSSRAVTSREVEDVKKQLEIPSKKRVKYLQWKPGERAEIGKYAREHA